MTNKEKVLVVGAGSIGRRHAKIFSEHFKIDIADISYSRIKLSNKLFKVNYSYFDFKKAIIENNYKFVAICTPPHLHLKIAQLSVKYNNNLFIEKPLGINCKGWKKVSKECKKKKLINYVAYCHRHISYFNRAKKMIDNNKIGKILHANMRWGSYLPDWHPWEKYYNFYMAKKEQGGGALLDESHGIDLIRYLIGEIEEVSAFVGKISDLKITSDDMAILNLKTNKNSYIQINFDLLARFPRNNLEIVGTKGTIIIDRVDHYLKIFLIKDKSWKKFKYKKDDFLNMYKQQAFYFINCINKRKRAIIDIDDALKTQSIIDSAFLSSKIKRNIKIK